MNKRKTILIILLLLTGVGVLAYPAVSNSVNRAFGSYAIQSFQAKIENADIVQERERAEAYNRKIQEYTVDGAFLEEIEQDYLAALNFGGGIMGYLQIPKIDVKLPIYHGTDETTLTKGVGHMMQSALPIGGEGNHTVLTGHTGLPSAKMFDELTELEAGDIFYVNVLSESLAYRVDQIKVVLPSEGQDLTAASGKDYCTLVTCTPYGINTHRLLVRGSRVDITAAEEKREDVIKSQESSRYLWIIAAAMALLFCMIFCVVKMDISSYQ